MKTANHIATPAVADPAVDRLAAAADSAVRRQLGGCEVVEVWVDGARTMFRTADGCVGEVEVAVVVWDVVAAESAAEGKHRP